VLAEFVNAMQKAIPGGWPLISLGILAMATGTAAYLKKGVVATGILILPVLITLVFIDRFIGVYFPRLFFSSMVFFLLIAVSGGFVLCQLVLPMISRRVVTVIGLIIALATATMVTGAWKPKQDFDAALTFINERRIPGDAVACAGLTHGPLRFYLGLDCVNVHSETELIELEQTHSRIWMLYTFPTQFQEPDSGPAMAAMIPAVAWITVLALLLWLFGISVGAVIFCFGFLRWHAGESWRFSTAFAAGLGFTLQIIFTLVLQLTLYSGVLLRAL
jgi:hypothetical protein